MNALQRAVEESTSLITARSAMRPRIAVVLGSGWQGLAQAIEQPVEIDYAELPAFPELGVAGHVGRLIIGCIAGVEVVVLAGRKHTYENGEADAMKGAIRSLAAAGIRTLLLTNAAGSLDAGMRPGSLMLVEDHLNMAQRTPLLGAMGAERFVDLRDAYDPALRAAALRVARDSGCLLHRGVYAWMLGPQFETPAEIRMLQLLGARAVGMSTVPETILARHAGLRVLALSLLTNLGCGMENQALSHAHTLAVAEQGGAAAVRFVQALLPALAASS